MLLSTVAVTTYSPMKRGLKVYTNDDATGALTKGYNLFPDEKGTERSISYHHATG